MIHTTNYDKEDAKRKIEELLDNYLPKPYRAGGEAGAILMNILRLYDGEEITDKMIAVEVDNFYNVY